MGGKIVRQGKRTIYYNTNIGVHYTGVDIQYILFLCQCFYRINFQWTILLLGQLFLDMYFLPSLLKASIQVKN